MTLNSNDISFVNGEIAVKVENEEQSRYLIGLSIMNDIDTCFTEIGDYDDYPYYAVLDGELTAYCEPSIRFELCDDFDFGLGERESV